MSRAEAVYARQSVEKKDSLSISGQIALCERAAGQSLQVYQDRGYSGKNTQRPGFQRLMQDVEGGRIGAVYVYRLDRFSRSVADFGHLWEVLQAHGVEFVSVNESFDTKTPMGRAMLHIIMVFAQLERETTAERVRDNYYRRAALGSWPGGPPPYGYQLGRAADRTGRQVPTLLPDQRQDLVPELYREYASEGMSLGLLARKLSAQGIPGPQRETWDSVTLSRLLHNPVYVQADREVRLHLLSLGVSVTSPEEDFDGVHGVLLVGKRDRSGKGPQTAKSPAASVLNSVGLVPSGLWLRVQTKLAGNDQVGNSGRGKHTWLSGLLKCAKCGYSLKVTTRKARRYLTCSGRYQPSRCDATPGASLDQLEETAQAGITALLADCPPPPSVREDSFAAPLRELDRRADRLVDAFSGSDMDPAYLRRALRRLEEERKALLEAQKRQAATLPPDSITFSALSFQEKKTVAAQFLRRVNVGETQAEFLWRV